MDPAAVCRCLRKLPFRAHRELTKKVFPKGEWNTPPGACPARWRRILRTAHPELTSPPAVRPSHTIRNPGDGRSPSPPYASDPGRRVDFDSRRSLRRRPARCLKNGQANVHESWPRLPLVRLVPGDEYKRPRRVPARVDLRQLFRRVHSTGRIGVPTQAARPPWTVQDRPTRRYGWTTLHPQPLALTIRRYRQPVRDPACARCAPWLGPSAVPFPRA